MRFLHPLTCLVFLWLLMGCPVPGYAAKETDVPAKVKDYIDVLRTSKDMTQQQKAAEALGKLGTPAVVPLSEVLRDPNAEVRAVAAWAFGRFEQPVVAKAVPILLEAMRREKDAAVLEALAKAIAHAKEAAVPGLTDLTRTTTGDVRQMAFYSLGRLGGAARAAVPAMIELLAAKDDDVRYRAVYVLGRIGPDARASVPALLKLLRSSRAAQGPVIDALADIGAASDEVLAVVLKALNDPDPMVRVAAVGACAAFGPKAKEAVPDLIRLLDDDKVNDPGAYPGPVVYALGKVGPEAKAAGPKLLPLLKIPDIEHATHVAAALLRIGTEEKAAVAVFTRALDRSLQEEKAYIRYRTFGILEQMGSAAKPVVPLLLSIAKNLEEEDGIRFQATRILRQLDPAAAEKIENR